MAMFSPASNSQPQNIAKKVKKAEFAGKGALVQGIGLLLCIFLFPWGLIPGIVALIAGSQMSFRYSCSNCGNKVEKGTKICPHHNCGSRFE